jgi:hypothetical protein
MTPTEQNKSSLWWLLGQDLLGAVKLYLRVLVWGRMEKEALARTSV